MLHPLIGAGYPPMCFGLPSPHGAKSILSFPDWGNFWRDATRSTSVQPDRGMVWWVGGGVQNSQALERFPTAAVFALAVAFLFLVVFFSSLPACLSYAARCSPRRACPCLARPSGSQACRFRFCVFLFLFVLVFLVVVCIPNFLNSVPPTVNLFESQKL